MIKTISPIAETAAGPNLAATLKALLDNQRQAQEAQGIPSLKLRRDRLDRAIGLLVDYKREITDCLSQDFGQRSPYTSLVTDVFASIAPLKHAKAHVASWMKPESRPVQFPMNLLGGRARIEYVPKGVAGIISPWNFPVNMVFAPLAGALAAGNRVMIKPSEFTPATSELMQRMFRQAYDENEITVVTGGAAVGEAFSALPFDHLLFTGATSIARHIMRAAADNLVPVTLELGGKSPVILSKSAQMAVSTAKIMTGKTMNAGQICLAPDYVLVPEDNRDAFVAEAQKTIRTMYPTLKDNPDYSSIINQRHFDRLNGLIDDARAKGATIVEINPAHEDFSQQMAYKIPPTLVLDPTDDMKIMQDEIFGPLLPVKTYRDVKDAVQYINSKPRPLGLYHFGEDAQEIRTVLDSTISGGVTINDVIMHISVEDLPFGGVGPSGMGSYHGIEGFKTFSYARSIYTSPKIDIGSMLRPPFGKRIDGMMAKMIKR